MPRRAMPGCGENGPAPRRTRMSDRKRRRRLRLATLLPVVLLALVAGVLPATSASQPAPADVRVTALLASATNAPARVLGSDGMEHLEYDLVLTNVFTVPIT